MQCVGLAAAIDDYDTREGNGHGDRHSKLQRLDGYASVQDMGA